MAERGDNGVLRSAPEYVTKRRDDALVEPETMSEQEARGWNNRLTAHLNELREEVIDAVADTICDLRQERDAAIAKEVSQLKIEIAELRGELRAMREASHSAGLVGLDGNKLVRTNGAHKA